MKHQTTCILAALTLISVLPAQVQKTLRLALPGSNPVPRANSLPFGVAAGRYQQWFSPLELTATLKRPVRIRGIEFKALTSTGPSSKITLDVTMAKGSALGIGGTFASNLGTDAVLVLPKTTVTLARASAGTYTLSLMFQKDFKWDGQSGLVYDIRIYSNSQRKSFIYDFESTAISKRRVMRLYNTKSASAKSGTLADGSGLTTRLVYQEGGSYPYGFGCAGAKNVVPVASSNRVPLPGDNGWTQIVSNTSPGKNAVLFFGLSDKTWAGAKLPYDTTAIGWKNCAIYAEPFFMMFTKTSGGSPGNSTAIQVTPIPAIGTFTGLSVFSQWAVFDTNAANGWVSFTPGLHHVIGG